MATKDTHEPTQRNWVSFWSLMGLQAQNAFNDKALQYTLLPLGVWIASGAAWESSFAHVLGILILLPFILFSPIAGWMGDNFSKTRVIRLAAWMQLSVLLVVLAAFGMRFLPLAVFCFFLLALQSTILSPSKLGIIKELLGSSRLGFASGVMEMFTILAILAGQILISFWFTARNTALDDGWQAGLFPMLVITGGAVVTLVMAYSIQVVPPQSKTPFKKSMIFSHFKQLGHLFATRPLRLSAIGVAYFWAFGAIVQLVSIQIAREIYTKGDPYFASSTAWMMLAAGGGIALGSILAAMINKRHIELGLLPLGGIIMTISTLTLVLTRPESGPFYLTMAAAGFGAAFFFVPVNAYLQDECDPSQRGNVLAASNLLNCLAMVVAVVLQLVMVKLGFSWQLQFFLVGLTVVASTIYVMRLLPRAFVKLLVMSAMRAVYRIEAIHADRMPKEGGVLLLSNHLSYLDALVLTAASPRPIRFIMIRNYFEVPMVGKFARLFDTIPISQERAKDAIRISAEAVEEGNVVCLFPEGQLSRSGMMLNLKKGFELIARRTKSPVQVAYLDGLWKSIFSAERGRFFWKIPRSVPFGVRVAFSEPRMPEEMDTAEVRREFNALAGEVFSRRRELADDVEALLKRRDATARALAWWDHGHQSSCSWRDVREVVEGIADPLEVARGHRGAAQWLAEWRELARLPEAELRGLVLNAHQVADPQDLGLGRTAVLLDSEAPLTVRRVWGMILPIIVKTYAVSYGPDDDLESFGHLLEHEPLRDLVGGERMRELMQAHASEFEHLCWYHFHAATQTSAEAGERSYTCREVGGRIVSLSMAHAPMVRTRDLPQAGWREGSPGRLLTGFVPNKREGGLAVEGEMVEGTIELDGWTLDEDGFLMPQS